MLNADILEGHLSSALCHLGNISYRLGKQSPVGDAKSRLKGAGCFGNVRPVCRALGRQSASGDPEITFGETLAFDPQTEKFVSNPTADAMLTREYRARSSCQPRSDRSRVARNMLTGVGFSIPTPVLFCAGHPDDTGEADHCTGVSSNRSFRGVAASRIFASASSTRIASLASCCFVSSEAPCSTATLERLRH